MFARALVMQVALSVCLCEYITYCARYIESVRARRLIFVHFEQDIRWVLNQLERGRDG